MGMNRDSTLKILKENRIAFAKDEFHKNRKINEKWKRVPSYPCPCQIIAKRMITPRGYQDKWSNGAITTFIPKKKGNSYCFEALATEEKDINQEKLHQLKWMPWWKRLFSS